MSPFSDYDQLMKLWQDYEFSLENHDCIYRTDEEFVRCEVCERATTARAILGGRLDQVMNLLEEHHKVLGELTLSIIQEDPPPRPERVQKALMEALGTLTKGKVAA